MVYLVGKKVTMMKGFWGYRIGNFYLWYFK